MSLNPQDKKRAVRGTTFETILLRYLASQAISQNSAILIECQYSSPCWPSFMEGHLHNAETQHDYSHANSSIRTLPNQVLPKPRTSSSGPISRI